MKPKHVFSESQAIENARNSIERAQVISVHQLEAGQGIDEGVNDRPAQTVYDCFIRDEGDLKVICKMYIRNGRVLGYYPYEPSGHCHDCGLVFCDEYGVENDHPELYTIFETLMNSKAEFTTNIEADYESILLCNRCKPLDVDPDIKEIFISFLAKYKPGGF